MANEGPFSFFYPDAPAGSPLSYESLQSRRKIAEALLGKRSPFPKTIGEGLTYAGESIADIAMQRKLDEAERGQAERDRSALQGMPRGEGVSYLAPGTPSTAETYTRPSFALPPEAKQPTPSPQQPPGDVITNPDDAGGIFGKNTRILGPAPAVADEGNPPIVVDIQPAPAKPLTLPSQQPIPAPVELSPPGVAPRPPDLLGPSQTMLYRDSLINSGKYSPHVIEALKQENLREELQRKDIQTKQQADYEFNRGRHYKTVDEYEKWIREGKLDEHVKRVGLEKAQSDLEEAYYKRGIPREQARVQADLDIQKGQRAVNAPNTFMAQGTQFQQQMDPRTGQPTGPYAVSPGAPAPEAKSPTETQAKAIEFVGRSARDLANADKNMNFGKALTNTAQAALDRYTPDLFANNVLSQDYKNARDAYGNWAKALMRHVSGAAYGLKEAVSELQAFVPTPGDNEARLRTKAQRRLDMNESIIASGGQMTADAVAGLNKKFLAEDRAADAPREGVTETNIRTGEKRIFRGGKWEPLR
jgi:hypothetical protein